MITKKMLASAAAALIVLPFIASAASVADLQAQIQTLLAQIQLLSGQGNTSASVSASGSGSLSGVVTASPSASCPTFARSLSIGSRGSDVTALQQYLQTQGYLSASATGYFGALTKAAVGKWQTQSGITASGTAGFGVFGPLSRAFFGKNCTAGVSGQRVGSTTASVNFFATPTFGAAPLSVQFSASAPQGTTFGNTINFGDGTSGTLGMVPVCSSCNAMGVVSHTYAAPGTYTATLTNNNCVCPANGICNCPNMMIFGTATVTVTGASTGTTSSNIQQLNAPGSVTLAQNGIAEVRNQSFYFTLTNLTGSSATVQLTPVGCWNSFPSDTPPQIRCMLAMLPIPPQTLTIGQAYDSANYGIQLTSIANNEATFSITAASSASM